MMITESVKSYMRDISEYPLLQPDEEVDLADQIHQGDRWALNQMIRSNLRLVVTIALELSNRGIPIEELISEGNVGLIQAAKKFDPTKGAKFSTYASWWIKQAMRRAITESGKVIRIPTSSFRKIRKIQRVGRELKEKLGREPTAAEIAGNSEFSVGVVTRLRDAELKTVSLQAPISEGESDTIINLIPNENTPSPDRDLVFRDLSDQMYGALPQLKGREQLIIKYRFGLDGRGIRTLEEISKELGLTRERVRQIQKRALEKLRKIMMEGEVEGALLPASTN